MERLHSFFGVILFLAFACLVSEKRKDIKKKILFWGIGIQLIFAVLVLGIPAMGVPGPLRVLFDLANDGILAILNFNQAGVRFLFGPLADAEKVGGFIFAIQVLPTIIFFSSLMAIAYHTGIMQRVVHAIAVVMHRAMGTSGAESLACAAEIFVGQTESPLMIKPYMPGLTRSELFGVMVGGMATVAGGVMAAYVGLLRDRIPDIAGHLLTASVLAAPAALVIAKLMIPETEHPETLGHVPKESEKIDKNVIEAAARGASEGLQLALNVGVMLMAFIALIALLNAGLGQMGEWVSFSSWGEKFIPPALLKNGEVVLSMQAILGWAFAPVAWLLGVPAQDVLSVGALLGEKVVLNEFVAYQHLSEIGSMMNDRSVVLASYALCGFANFSSIAIQIGGTGSLAPNKRSTIAELGLKAVLGGSLASFLTAAIAGMLI